MLRLWILLAALLSSGFGYFSLEVGDPCPTRNYRSYCQPAEQCASMQKFIQSGQLLARDVLNCGFTTWGEKICCPLETDDANLRLSGENATSTTTTTTAATTTTTTTTKATTTTTTSPPWLSIFNTNREYVQRSVSLNVPVNRDIIFPDDSTRSGASCQTPLYEGKCMGVSQCAGLQQLLDERRLIDDDIQTCRDGTIEEIICCPVTLSRLPFSQVGTDTRVGSEPPPQTYAPPAVTVGQPEADTVQALELMPHYTHLAALAYPNAAFDGHLHRCTAIVLTSQLLLCAAGCGKPSHAVFGVADMRDVDEDEDYLMDITRMAEYREDLAVLRLRRPLRLDRETASKVSLAPMCTQFEFKRLQASGKILTTAWAKGNDSDCSLYELPMRLLPADECRDVANIAALEESPSSHLCLAPLHADAVRPNNSSSCAPCPAVVGSVLHLLRPSGKRCVLGIATPTGNDCDAQKMYFTSALDAELLHFVHQQEQKLQ